MKKRACALLAALLCLAACAPQGNGGEGTLRIGVAVYKGTDTYINNMTQAMEAAAQAWSEESGERVQVTVSDAQESQNTQNEQIDRFLSLGYDVLCVNLVDRTDAARIIGKAREADVPVVFFNREPDRKSVV